MTPSTAAVMPSSTCTATSRVGIGHEREQECRGPAVRRSRPAAAAAPPQILRLAADPRRDQRDDELRHHDAGGDQHRRPVARAHRHDARPSAAASRRWRAGTAAMQQAKTISGRLRSRSPKIAPAALRMRAGNARRGLAPDRFRRGECRAEREQGRDAASTAVTKKTAARRTGIRTRPSRPRRRRCRSRRSRHCAPAVRRSPRGRPGRG